MLSEYASDHVLMSSCDIRSSGAASSVGVTGSPGGRAPLLRSLSRGLGC